MRALLASGALALSLLAEPERYLVIPVSRDEAMVQHCPAALSADGRVIAFDSDAALDPQDRNGNTDVYVLDQAHRRVTLASRSIAGAAGRGSSRCPSLSADGQRLVFESDATDLVEGDLNDAADVFFLDRSSGVLRKVSTWPDQRLASSSQASISGDGRQVAFDARNRDASPTARRRVFRSAPDQPMDPEEVAEGYSPTLNHDGRVVAYLVASGAGTSPALHVREGGMVREVARSRHQAADAPVQTPLLSGDGSWITYVSRATNLIADRQLSGRSHVYLERVADGLRYIVSASADGREANGHSTRPAVDDSAERVVFQSTATNLACGKRGPACDSDINLVADTFSWQRSTNAMTRVNGATAALRWLEGSIAPAISGDGRVVAFLSRQAIDENDDAGTFDLFVIRR